jgi:hypothetical protein
LMAPPPPVPVSPGLAGNSVMLSAMQGRADNPYLAQQQKASDSAADQHQGMMKMAGQMQQQDLAQQAQMLRMQEMRNRQERFRAAQETKKHELDIKVGLDLLKLEGPAKKVGADRVANWLNQTQKIPVTAEQLLTADKTFKPEDRKHIHSMLDAKIPFDKIRATFPNATDEFLMTEQQVLDNDQARGVLGYKKEIDPLQAVADANADLAEKWKKGRGYTQGTDFAEVYARVAPRYLAMSKLNPLAPQGRELFRSQEQEEPIVQAMWAEERENVRILKERAEIAARVETARRVAAEKLDAKEDKPIDWKEIPNLFHPKTRRNPTPDMTDSQVRSERFVKLSPRNAEAVGHASTIERFLNEINEINERNPAAITAFATNGKITEAISADVGKLKAAMIALPLTIRNFGQVGDLSGPEQERAIGSVTGWGGQKTNREKLKIVTGLVNARLKHWGLEGITLTVPPDATPRRASRADRRTPGPLSPELPEPPAGGRRVN